MNEALEQLARKLRLDDHDNANHHQGSKSIDSCGGNWRQAADYAACATVYGQDLPVVSEAGQPIDKEDPAP